MSLAFYLTNRNHTQFKLLVVRTEKYFIIVNLRPDTNVC